MIEALNAAIEGVAHDRLIPGRGPTVPIRQDSDSRDDNFLQASGLKVEPLIERKKGMNTKHMLKPIGLSLLVAVCVLAASVTEAHAKWQILLNGFQVNGINLNMTVPKIHLLVPGLGLSIVCNGGTGEVEAKLSNEDQVLTVSAVEMSTGCDDANFGEVCDVRSTGQKAGAIVSSGSGTAAMAGENEYFVDVSSNEFTNIEYIGEECPLTEIDGRVSGKKRTHVLNALENTVLKIGHTLDKGLFFGEEEATLHDGNEGPPLSSITQPHDFIWSLHLVGL